MTIDMRHVHVGPGPLGLGLIVPLTSRTPLTISVAYKPCDKFDALQRHRGYYWQDSADVGGLVPQRLDELIATDAQLAGRISDSDTVLLTFAVGDLLEDLVPKLNSYLEARSAAHAPTPLFVIACENIVGEKYKHLKTLDFGGRVVFLDCVVDRMCHRPLHIHEDGHVVVRAENYAEWTIKRAGESAAHLEPLLGSLPEVAFVDKITPARTRKKWMVNGPHLAVAALAWNADEVKFDKYVRDDGREYLEAVVEECAAAYQATYPNSGDLADHIQRNLERFRRVPMATTGILKRLTEDSLPELMRAVQDRIIEPSRAYSAHHGGRMPPMLTMGLHALSELIADKRFVPKARRDPT